MGEAVEHFSYDPVGNRTTNTKTGTNLWSYNKNNELQSFDNTSFKYNLNGQMTEKTVSGTTTYYSYNLDGRLKEIKDNSNQVIAQYEYDPFGRRTKKYLPQTNEIIYFHYSDEGLIAEYDETGQLIQSYGYKPDSLFTTEPVFTHRPDFLEAKGYAYYINDHLGTPQKLITNTGRKVWEASEDAFGQTVISNNEFRNPLRFPGQYTDDESFLRYNYFRYYDPQGGRYITSDPIGLEGGLNTYGYVYQNPLNWIDSFGLAVDQYGNDSKWARWNTGSNSSFPASHNNKMWSDCYSKCFNKGLSDDDKKLCSGAGGVVGKIKKSTPAGMGTGLACTVTMLHAKCSLQCPTSYCPDDTPALPQSPIPVPKYQPIPAPMPQYQYPPNTWRGKNPLSGPTSQPPYQWPPSN